LVPFLSGGGTGRGRGLGGGWWVRGTMPKIGHACPKKVWRPPVSGHGFQTLNMEKNYADSEEPLPTLIKEEASLVPGITPPPLLGRKRDQWGSGGLG